MKSFKDWFPNSNVEYQYNNDWSVGPDQETGVLVHVDNGMKITKLEGVEPLTSKQAELIFTAIEEFQRANIEQPIDEEEPYYPRYNHE